MKNENNTLKLFGAFGLAALLAPSTVFAQQNNEKTIEQQINELRGRCSLQSLELDPSTDHKALLAGCMKLKSLLQQQRAMALVSLSKDKTTDKKELQARAANYTNAVAVTDLQSKEADQVMDKAKDSAQKYQQFAGINWGLGIAMTGVFGQPYVESADVVDDIVRVSKSYNMTAGLMYETHYFTHQDEDKTRGWGPFVAIELVNAEQSKIGAFGAGVMWGFRQDMKTKNSWNLGVGVYINPNHQLLGHNIRANQPLPGNETKVRYYKTDRYGLMFLVSYTFF